MSSGRPTGKSSAYQSLHASRGVGCFMESLSHGMEGTANSGAIPYFTRYFKEYADFNLKERYGLPFDSRYGVDYGEVQIKYPDQKTKVVTHGGKEYRVENYTAAGGKPTAWDDVSHVVEYQIQFNNALVLKAVRRPR